VNDCGLMEDRPAAPEEGAPSIVETNRHLRDVLLAKGYRVRYAEFNGGHEYLNWRGTLAGRLLVYDSLALAFDIVDLEKNPACTVCSKIS